LENPNKKKRRARANSAANTGPTYQNGLHIKRVTPLTENQKRAFEGYRSGKHLMLHGMAGTGKTMVSLYLALNDVEAGLHDRVAIVRSAVPTRDQGFLPGSLKEKSRVYEAPFVSACSDIYGRQDAYDYLKHKGTIEFITTSYIRGITLSDTVIIMDECQNMKFHEIDSVITRIGKNSRIIAIGDFRQSDLTRSDERRGITDFLRVAKAMGSFDLIEFGYDDILRSDTVREYLIVRDKLGIQD
jgi:phosphate starvation-inducible protein PhoH and related proteins